MHSFNHLTFPQEKALTSKHRVVIDYPCFQQELLSDQQQLQLPLGALALQVHNEEQGRTNISEG